MTKKHKDLRFKDALRESIESAAARGLEPATLKSYRYYTKNILAPLGNKKLRNLRPEHFDRLFRDMKEHYDPSTIHKAKVVAGLALKLADWKHAHRTACGLDDTRVYDFIPVLDERAIRCMYCVDRVPADLWDQAEAAVSKATTDLTRGNQS